MGASMTVCRYGDAKLSVGLMDTTMNGMDITSPKKRSDLLSVNAVVDMIGWCGMKLTNIKIGSDDKVSIRLVPETSVDRNLLDLLRTGDYQPDGMRYDREDTIYGGFGVQERQIKALVVYLGPDGSED